MKSINRVGEINMTPPKTNQRANEVWLNYSEKEQKGAKKLSQQYPKNLSELFPSKNPTTTECSQNVDERAFYSSISPLTFSMRLFGLYFEVNNTRKSQNRSWCDLQFIRSAASQLYCSIVLIVHRLDLARMMSIFKPENQLNSPLFSKISSILFELAISLMTTCYYVACSNGQLTRLFCQIVKYKKDEEDDLTSSLMNREQERSMIDSLVKTCSTNGDSPRPLNKADDVCIEEYDGSSGDRGEKEEREQGVKDHSRDTDTSTSEAAAAGFNTFLHQVRYTARVCTAVAWLAYVINIILTGYALFNTTLLKDVVAPLNTYMTASNDVILAAKCAFIVLYAYIMGTSCFTPAITFFIAVTLWREFRTFNGRFKRSICGRQFHGDFELYRLRHQRLSHLVEKADRIVWLCNGGNIVCHLGTTVIELYNLIWFTAPERNRHVLCLFIFYMLSSVAKVYIASFGAILVNNSVELFYLSIYPLSLTTP